MIQHPIKSFRKHRDISFVTTGLILGASSIAIIAIQSRIAIISGIIGIIISIIIAGLAIAIGRRGGIKNID